MNTNIPTEEPLLEWNAAQVIQHEHTARWYLCAALALALCLTYAVWTSAWSFAAVLIIATGVYLYAHRIEPKEHRMRLWKRGFALDDTFTPWEKCHGFWIEERIHPHTLTIELKQTFTPFAKIQLGDLDVHAVHNLIVQFTPEMPRRKENIVDILIHFCKL